MSVIPHLKILGGIALDLLFPKRCVGCGSEGVFICGRCQTGLKRITPPICMKCGRPEINGIICADCINSQSDLDGIRSLFRFEGVIRQAIHQLKYKNVRALAGPLAQLMADYIGDDLPTSEIAIPVPLHPKRLRERGYNQSELLARELSKLTRMPVEKNALFRKKYTTAQAKTRSVEERRTNMIDAFECNAEMVKDREIILIDDVATSATTLEACATTLKKGGALSVWGLVLAREI